MNKLKKEFKVRDLAYGGNELIASPWLIRDGNNENARVVHQIDILENDNYLLYFHADRRVVTGDYLLYIW